MRFYPNIYVHLIFICLLFGHFSHASDSINNDVCSTLQSKYDLKQQIETMPSFYKSLLIQNILNVVSAAEVNARLNFLDFKKLKYDIENNINLCVYRGTDFLIGSGTRKGSVNFTKEKAIIFNVKKLLSQFTIGSGLTMFHEFLGALGYPDQNYAITLYVYALVQIKDFGEETVRAIEKAASRYYERTGIFNENIMYAMNGGVTGVGGGGDTESVLLKISAIVFALNSCDEFSQRFGTKMSKDDFSLFLLKYRIESSEIYPFPANTKLTNFVLFDGQVGIVFKAGVWNKLLQSGPQNNLEEKREFLREISFGMAVNYIAGVPNENK